MFSSSKDHKLQLWWKDSNDTKANRAANTSTHPLGVWTQGKFHCDRISLVILNRSITDMAHLPFSPQSSPNYPLSEFLHLPHSHLRHRRPDLLPHPVAHHQRPAAIARSRKLHLGQPAGGRARRVSGSGLPTVDRNDIPGELLVDAEHDGPGVPWELGLSGVLPRWGEWRTEAIYAAILRRSMDEYGRAEAWVNASWVPLLGQGRGMQRLEPGVFVDLATREPGVSWIWRFTEPAIRFVDLAFREPGVSWTWRFMGRSFLGKARKGVVPLTQRGLKKRITKWEDQSGLKGDIFFRN